MEHSGERTTSISFPIEEYNVLKEIARKEGVTIKDLIRSCLSRCRSDYQKAVLDADKDRLFNMHVKETVCS